MSVPPSKLTKLYYLARVMSLPSHVPHSPLGILNITLVAGNDVNMYVEDTLPGRRPYINADIIAVGLKLRVEELFFLTNQLHTSSHLFRCQLEKTGHMAFRDNHRMSRARRVAITRAVR